jgi:hypothetical protein
MPRAQTTMPNPGKNVPANPWCPHSGSSAYGMGAGWIASAAWIILGVALVRRRPLEESR